MVGLSGGVDSTATFLLLRRQGFDPLGVHLAMGRDPDDLDRRRLQALEERLDARIHRIDCHQEFCQRVTAPFLEAYGRCETPNPCVICNEQLKIRLLVEAADDLGCRWIATGHYARTVETPQGWAIARSRSSKDQSYMLYRLLPQWIPRLIFPLADMEKSQTRQISAEALGDDFAGGDSQDICFLEGQSLAQYLEDRLPQESLRPGEMVCCGQVVGRHRGLAFYTEGQRKGLGLSGGPWFVKAKDRDHNRLVLSHRQDSAVSEIFFKSPRWQRTPQVGQSYLAQHRYRSTPVPARLAEWDGCRGRVVPEVPLTGVALGQSLVLYCGNLLVGGGIICRRGEVEP